jgi:hypothetical protein
MHKSATKCNETLGKWCKNKHEASKIIDTLKTYQVLMKKFVTLGTECAEYLKAARASKGDLLFYALLRLRSFLCFFIILTFPFLLTIDALATANARIASLEAELDALRKAFDTATAAKASAEKTSKSALAKTKKLDKSLADLRKEQTQ